MQSCKLQKHRWMKLQAHKALTGILAFGMAFSPALPVQAMEAPGNGGAGWVYNQKDYHWYYFDEEKQPHTGWLNYEGEWYWFDQDGRMAEGGYHNIDGLQYYFFINGNMAWNQYVGFQYYDEKGQAEDAHDIRIIGTERPTNEDRDLLSDELYCVPRGWIAQFVQDGWQFMFYKKKTYFEAPSTDMGIYYVYHSVDTHYKKVKFTETDAVLQGFGEYVGRAAGCYKKGNEQMSVLWDEMQALDTLLEIPGYYANDAAFYFGKLFAAYLSEETRERMEKISPKACEVMEEIIHMKDDPEVLARRKARKEAAEAAAAERLAREIPEEGYGPGVSRPENQESSDNQE